MLLPVYAKTETPQLKAKLRKVKLSQKAIKYQKAIEKINFDCLKLKPRILLNQKLHPGFQLEIRGRRFAQGEILFIKIITKADMQPIAKVIYFWLNMGKASFQFFPSVKSKKDDKTYETLLPISPREELGKKTLYLHGKYLDKAKREKRFSKSISIKIKSGNFIKTHIKRSLKVKRKYTSRLSAKMKKIVKEQIRRIRVALRSSKKGKKFWSLPFIHPTGGTVITSPFWIQRFYNKKPGSLHGGTDFRGRTGHPVKAINSGIVVFSENTFYAGKTIIIDHGDRFFSLYMHQSKLLVKKGDRVSKGKRIGRIGKSGLATGPHLHLGIIMKGIKADPISILYL